MNENPASRLTELLIERTIALLLGPVSLPHSEFVAVRGEILASRVAPWVMLTAQEFKQVFGPGSALQ